MTLEIDAQRVRAKASDGGTGEADLRHDSLRANTIQVLESWIRRSAGVSRGELEVLGEHLFETVFQGDVRQMLVARLDDATSQSPLRLQLSFLESAKDLAKYSWEYLYFRESGGRAFFLSTYTKLVLARFMPRPTKRTPLGNHRRELGILLAIAEPEVEQLGPVAAQQVIDAVREVAAELGQGFRLTASEQLLRCPTRVEVIDKTTADKLVSEINRLKPNIVHIIGHGRFDRATGVGAIALLKNDEVSVDWVSDKQCNDRFVNLDNRPNIVFLHMCQGGEVAFERNFAGVAPQLIAAGVQAVIAMQHPISNPAAISFAISFYKQIASGKTIDYAVQFGRHVVSGCDRTFVAEHAFGTPVLYMQASDGIIIPIPERGPADQDDQADGRTADKPLSSTAAGQERQNAPSQRNASVQSPERAPPQTTAAGLAAAPSGSGTLVQVAASSGSSANDLLRDMRRAGRTSAAKQGRLNSTLANQIDNLARCVNVERARDELTELIDRENDDTLQLVWSEMMAVISL